jgi:phage tail-like protein
MPSFGLNAAFSLVTNLLGVRADPFQGFNFLIEIEGILAGGFSECSGLQVETEVVEFAEGGNNDFVHQFAGRTKYPPLILKHGITLIDGLWSWHQDVTKGTIKRRNATIYLLNKERLPMIWWDVKQALPVKWTGPDLRAESGSVAFESLDLRHKGLGRPSVAGAIAGALGDIGASLGISGSIGGGAF